MLEERPPTEVEAQLDRISEDGDEYSVRTREIDRAMTAVEHGYQDLRKDVRQVRHLVILWIVVSSLLELL